MQRAFNESQHNSHLGNIWKVYEGIGNKLIELMKLTESKQNDDIHREIERINKENDGEIIEPVIRSELTNCFENILITFGDCDDSEYFIKPMQILIKSYIDPIFFKNTDSEILIDSDHIHYIYQHILTDNDALCREYFVEKGAFDRFALYEHSWKSFQTQPHLMLGFLASLCSSQYTAQKVYELFSRSKPYYTIKSQIEDYITTQQQRSDARQDI